MKTIKSSADNTRSVPTFFQSLKEKIANFFRPEEVEVTFKEDANGNVISYTYTEVPHKHVA